MDITTGRAPPPALSRFKWGDVLSGLLSGLLSGNKMSRRREGNTASEGYTGQAGKHTSQLGGAGIRSLEYEFRSPFFLGGGAPPLFPLFSPAPRAY